MSYYHVLGYSDNPVVKEYYEKYFQKLKKFFQEIDFSGSIKEDFLALSEERQKYFLCKADILTLVHYIVEFKYTDFIAKLEQECKYFLEGREDLCTYSL